MKETLVQNISFEDDKFKMFIDSRSPSNVDTAVHEELEIRLQIVGNSTVCVDGEFFVLEKGDALVVNPLQLHSAMKENATSDSQYLLLMINLDFFDDSFFVHDLNLKKKFFIEGIRFNNIFRNNVKLATLIERVFLELKNKDNYHRVLVKSLLCELLVFLFRECRSDVVISKNKTKEHSVDVILPAINHMVENFSQQITLDELSNLCGLSRYYFSRVFKNLVGQTPMNYLLALRINFAKVLLKSARCNIDVVASKCGFTDVPYFSNVFKKVVGVSPSAFRDER